MHSRQGMLPLVVRELTAQTPTIVSIRLESERREPLPPWEPGAHIDVQLLTRHERQYSLCGDPHDDRSYRIAVLREELSRGASHYIHSFLRVGARVYARPPRNLFPLAGAASYLLIAAGIGITPILAMARHLASRGEDWRLVYLVRRSEDVAFATELAALGEGVRIHASSEEGRLDTAELLTAVRPGTDVYACGPQRLLDSLDDHAVLLPSDSTLRTERFEPVRKDFLPDTPFTVTCARSEKTVEVPTDSTLLLALAKADIEVPASCLRGVCGTCAVPLLGGRAEHRDSLGTDDGSGLIYPCVSRAIDTTLTLDV
ncbi:PDR/VanB family oxidoreductase [Microbacterium sp. HD4P20]|uniref:PDR/VanB family oxidoreductase n=1 Tax=Microbacterium sp. HD4P20 TaxID=2864874 RepID=UPI001C642E3D|nr:PDR/VanB family oxidoreductase [Microbacterium sp. HD4P20]MCP2635415.1 PDR/VanB family oxidoreductase [Microbacterium sp. HD4P20]